MKKLTLKTLLFLSPFIPLLITYMVLDPFKVVKKYDVLLDSLSSKQVTLNKDYISTTVFDNNYRRERYNSFIFGNSRSIFYQVSEWKKYLEPNSSCFHFDATGESIYGLHKKVKYIDSKNLEIRNALLILDYQILLRDKPYDDHLKIIAPQLENNKNLLAFQLSFFKTFLLPKFFAPYIFFKATGKTNLFVKGNRLCTDMLLVHHPITNEIRTNQSEELIEKGQYYNPEKMKEFYPRDTVQTYSPACILENQKRMLREIHAVFVKHQTNCKIVISPLYDQEKFNSRDLEYLKKLFGEKNVFDFSGINPITQDYKNYYENSHYRPHVAKEIMAIIYNNKGNSQANQ